MQNNTQRGAVVSSTDLKCWSEMNRRITAVVNKKSSCKNGKIWDQKDTGQTGEMGGGDYAQCQFHKNYSQCKRHANTDL
jgi:hypothetical protein